MLPALMTVLHHFTSATHVYQEYTCEIIKNANGYIKLKYYNASDVLTSVDITN